jgi:hypothetical protein
MRLPLPPLLLALLLLPTVAAQVQGETVTLLAPAEGQTVAGLVTIAGTAASPAFQRYEMDFGYDPNPTDTWFPMQDPVLTPQLGGPLAQWDTLGLGIADGTYVIRLRMYRTDGSFAEAFLHNLVLQNGSPAGPAAAPGETGQPAPPSETPTATGVFVDLPPTSTPRPTVTPQPSLAPRPGPTPIDLGPSFSLQSFEQALVRGVGWTVAAFVALGLYALLRSRLRPGLRRLMRRLIKQR